MGLCGGRPARVSKSGRGASGRWRHASCPLMGCAWLICGTFRLKKKHWSLSPASLPVAPSLLLGPTRSRPYVLTMMQQTSSDEAIQQPLAAFDPCINAPLHHGPDRQPFPSGLLFIMTSTATRPRPRPFMPLSILGLLFTTIALEPRPTGVVFCIRFAHSLSRLEV